MFQFHTGSIKRIRSLPSNIGDPTFQFHTGSIKSLSTLAFVIHFHTFQFHTGSIKSFTGGAVAVLEMRFNSILVRLKEPEAEPDDLYAAVSIPYWFD